MPKANGWILGLDIGANSIGWMLVRQEPVEGERNLIGGVRVLGTRTEKNVETSACGERRTARGMRRQIDRRARRRRKLRYVLRETGILPSHETAIAEMVQIDPYEVRARGLHKPLTPLELARALTHLNRNRGFQSNRRISKSSDDGTVAKAISQLEQEIAKADCQTVGEYLHKVIPADRERRRGRYLSRQMIRTEFELLWSRQAVFHPELLTQDAYQKISDAIFFQRPFDKVTVDKVGRCSFEPEEPRARLGHRLAHRYRILTEVDNIRVVPSDLPGLQPDGSLGPELRKRLVDALQHNPRLSMNRITKLLALPQHAVINLGRGRREELRGNITEQTLRTAFTPARWDTFSDEEKDSICEACLELDDAPLAELAAETWNLPDAGIQHLIANPLGPLRHGRVSVKALRKLIPLLEAGKSLTEARTELYGERTQPGATSTPYPLLPFPPGCGQQFTGRGLEVARSRRLIFEEDSQPIINPVVRKALFEVRKVVNAIIREYGRPEIIRVELARETRGSIEERNARTYENAKRRKENEVIKSKIRDIFRKMGKNDEPTGGDVLKYRLWEECRYESPYSGRPIREDQLFTGEVQVDHILPFSRTLDDSFANKVLCFVDENQDKEDRTPWEWKGTSDPDGYARMLERVRRFTGRYAFRKRQNFERKSLEGLEGFISRKLTDTQYIARQVHGYLKCLYRPDEGVRVQVSRGDATATLRHLWGLDTILWDLNHVPEEERSTEKNRGDHRHHAIDAAVIALTSPAVLCQFSRRLILKEARQPFPQPWSTFRDELRQEIEAIHVSHAPTRRLRGALHDAMLHRSSEDPGMYARRIPIASLTPDQIGCVIDPVILGLIQAALRDAGINEKKPDKKAVASILSAPGAIRLPNCPAPVRRVRVWIRGSNLKPLKRSGGTIAYVKPDSNHHVEIFDRKLKGKTVRDAVVVSLMEANRRLRSGEPVISKVHPSDPDAIFVMSLCKNDMVFARSSPDSPEVLCRVVKIAKTEISEEYVLRPSHVAVAPPDEKTSPWRWQSTKKLDLIVRKVTLNPLGRIEECRD